jgi:hypothetical protein
LAATLPLQAGRGEVMNPGDRRHHRLRPIRLAKADVIRNAPPWQQLTELAVYPCLDGNYRIIPKAASWRVLALQISCKPLHPALTQLRALSLVLKILVLYQQLTSGPSATAWKQPHTGGHIRCPSGSGSS